MIAVIDRSCNWIRNHFNKEKVNKFSIVVIMIYYYIGLLSYITVPIKPLYRLFTSNSSFSVVIRALMTAIILMYSLLVVIVNKEKAQWKWLVVFIYVLLFTLVSTVISPQTYNYIYVSGGNYSVVYWVQASTGFNRLFTMYLSSISDFALAFCFLFILPLVINNKKQLLMLTLPIVLIGLIECAYSIVFEKNMYINLINFVDPQYGGYNIDIGASFGNKQDWGAFATVAFTCSLVSAMCLCCNGWKKVLFFFLLVLASLIIFVFTIASLCKTAIFSELLVYIVLLFYVAYYLIKRHFIATSVVYIGFVSAIFLLIVSFYLIPSLHASGILEKIYNITYSFIVGKIIGGAASGRTTIWLRLIENFRTYNLFFGLSKGGVSTYSQVVTVEGQSSLHNGFVFFLASYGLFGFSLYLILLFMVIYRIFKLKAVDSKYFFVSIGALGAALIFSLSEAEVLIISGSNPIFVFNVLLCVIPQGLLLSNKRKAISSNEI